MNLLTLVQKASVQLGLSKPTAVVGNTDVNVAQLYELLNESGLELTRSYPWQALDKEYRFTTVSSVLTGTTTSGSAVVTGISSTAGLDTTYSVTGTGIGADSSILSVDSGTQVTLNQTATASGSVSLTFGKTKYTLPTDYDRQVSRTQFDKSRRWQMIGPLTSQQWQNVKNSWVASAPSIRYRILGSSFQIWPIVTTGDVLGFEYIGNGWVTSVAGASQTSFLLDTDTCIFSDQLMILALKKKYFEIKGFDTQYFERDFSIELNRAKIADGGARTLSMAPRAQSILIGQQNIPDSLYGQ